MVSTEEQETLELRALKLQTPIKGTFGLSTLTRRFPQLPGRYFEMCNVILTMAWVPMYLT